MNISSLTSEIDSKIFYEIVEQLSDHLMITDKEGVILYVNPAFEKTTGWSQEEVVGKTPRILKSGKQTFEYYRGLWSTILAGKVFRAKPIEIKKNGEFYVADETIIPIRNHRGEITFFVALWKDITDLVKFEEQLKSENEQIRNLYSELEVKNKQLEQLDERKDEFINNVSHELRTPLTIIQESIKQVQEGLHGDVNDRQNIYLKKSLNNIKRLTNIINELLDISSIEKGKLKLHKRKIDFSELIQEVIADFEIQISKKGLTIIFNAPQVPVYIYVDKDKMIQVLTNIIGNSYKFTDQGCIEVSLKDNDQSIDCCIKDTGRGIAAEDLPRLFSKFEQFGRQIGAGSKGTGLGLSIAKSIIELHEGTVNVQSQLNEGSSFSISLPKLLPPKGSKVVLLNCLKEYKNKYQNYSVLIFQYKIVSESKEILLQKLENLIHQNIYHPSDKVIRDQDYLLVILPNTKKEGAIVVSERIQQMLQSNENTSVLTELSVQVMNFPEDGLSDEELALKLDQY